MYLYRSARCTAAQRSYESSAHAATPGVGCPCSTPHWYSIIFQFSWAPKRHMSFYFLSVGYVFVPISTVHCCPEELWVKCACSNSRRRLPLLDPLLVSHHFPPDVLIEFRKKLKYFSARRAARVWSRISVSAVRLGHTSHPGCRACSEIWLIQGR